MLAAAVARQVLRRRPVVLAYHGVAATTARDDPNFLCLPPARFRRQVAVLRAAGATFVTVAELGARLRQDGRAAGLVALTFDDGMQDNHAVLLPILRELELPATVFVATGLLGQPNPWMRPGSGIRMMAAQEVIEVAAAGVEIGAHTVTHPDLSTLPLGACREETAASRRTLEGLLGRSVTSFAYPYFHYGPVALRAVADAGFTAAVTGLGRGSFRSPLELPRVLVTGKTTLPAFLLRLTGQYDALFGSPPVRLIRTATRGMRRRGRALREAPPTRPVRGVVSAA